MTREEHKALIGTLLADNVSQADIMGVVTKLESDYEEMHTTLSTSNEQVTFYKEESAKFSKNCNELYQRIGISSNDHTDTTKLNDQQEPPEKRTFDSLFED